ncbi:hypothetical protein BDY17DRAFT_309188 [Neohortaea acidophila]|uniref:Uncharacterized protein n=1 Tax=Neohortaea acidophila TaxID=245834 RepID=A0A6A6PVN6_9PEZI|nr:uncharacterized protein BDY17DRAFT_309188 [Neohortaea acidophila]KAF2483804.1 hypothetical protein BDY17DRAFT_309188 [Neohortaea acidophila]
MIPSKLTRAAHRATAATPSPAGYACLSSRTHHHRRYSSSKASSADRDSAKAATAAAKPTVAAAKAQQSSTPSEASHASRSSKSKPRRDYRRLQTGLESKKNGQSDSPHDLRALPSAPSVQNLSETDRSLSNFFSLHRPMSINPSFPPTSTPEAFGKIFTTESSQDAWANGNSAERRPEDVIYTLHSTFETIESGAGQSQDDAVRYEIIHESPSNQSSQVHHLDGPPRLRSLEELVAQFKPFRAPPPPQPFPEYEGKQKGMDKRSGASGHAASRHANQPRQKTFTTTITVTESTHADGQKTACRGYGKKAMFKR